MCLPVNIKSLVHGDTIEWGRMAFKQRWDPRSVLHTICAFANDIRGWGGGYIIIGLSQNDALAGLPLKGLSPGQLCTIQKEILLLGQTIEPHYSPITTSYRLDGRSILVLWCPAGDHRPYSALSTPDGDSQCLPYVRIGSKSISPRGATLKRLQERSPRIPFDDRVNQRASIRDLDVGLIRAYLQETGSDLYEECLHMPLADICRAMHIAKGPDEDLRPVNAGLLFFSKQPEEFFPYAWIELVWHRDESGKNFSAYYFKGPLQ
jgi:ATP-dependent DNA helicase RecG